MLSERLKTETRALHTAVEQSAFVQALFRGELDQPAYALFLRNLREIYAALEAVLACQPPGCAVSLVWSPALVRLTSIERDLETLHGNDWLGELEVQPVTLRYVERIEELANRPELLVAHAYVRYLGDLNGGQTLARLVRRRFELPNNGGVAFYDFGSPEVVRSLKQVFKDGLDQIGGWSIDATPIVEEAKLAFRLHAELFDELAGACIAT